VAGEVLGQDLREVEGPVEAPSQYWSLGGMQFMASPDFQAPPSNDAAAARRGCPPSA